MARASKVVLVVTALTLVTLVSPISAPADTASCHATIAKSLRKFKKIHLKQHIKCLRSQNLGRINGPCPDAAAQLKIQDTATAANAKIAAACTPSDLATLEYRTDCAYEVATSGEEAVCAAMPVLTGPDIDPTKLAQCLECWKAAELSEYIAILYPSHALEVCGGDLSESSSVCSNLDCTTPLPDQRDLNGGEGDCQHGIGKAGFKYIFKREKILEKCALDGGTQATCLADLDVQVKLDKAEQRKMAKIQSKCGNRDPAATTPFCCRTGGGNACMAAATRADCENVVMGDVQEDKTCNGVTCDPVMGNKKVTWWEFCPESASCPGTPMSTLADLTDCVDVAADAISDELLCLQFRGNNGADWPCPAD